MIRSLLYLCTLVFAMAPGLNAAEPLSAEELLQSASQAEAQGYHSLAIHYYSHALKARPQSLEIERTLARLLQANEHYGIAEIHWRHILELRPNDSEATKALNTKASERPTPVPDHAVTSLPPVTKAEIPWNKGHGAWVYGEPRAWATVLNTYNASAPQTQRVKYIFPYSGSITFNGGSAGLQIDLAKALILADNVSGEARIIPMIDGVSAGCASIGEKEWDRVAKEIAEKINSDTRIAGVQFDIEPHDPKLHALFAYVKKYTQKPVGAAVGTWEKNTFKYVDYLVLMAYDQATEPSNYLSSVRDLVRSFMRDARDANTKVLIGSPAIATHHEYETFSTTATGERLSTAHKMKDYVVALRRATGLALIQDDPSYLGLSIWALHPEGGVHLAADTKWFFPSVIAPEVWELFKLPLEAIEP